MLLHVSEESEGTRVAIRGKKECIFDRHVGDAAKHSGQCLEPWKCQCNFSRTRGKKVSQALFNWTRSLRNDLKVFPSAKQTSCLATMWVLWISHRTMTAFNSSCSSANCPFGTKGHVRKTFLFSAFLLTETSEHATKFSFFRPASWPTFAGTLFKFHVQMERTWHGVVEQLVWWESLCAAQHLSLGMAHCDHKWQGYWKIFVF